MAAVQKFQEYQDFGLLGLEFRDCFVQSLLDFLEDLDVVLGYKGYRSTLLPYPCRATYAMDIIFSWAQIVVDHKIDI